MKKYLFTFLTLLFFSIPVFAESSLELCNTEAKNAGIDDAIEFDKYVTDCVAQLSASEQANQQNSESDKDEIGKGMAASD